MFDMVFEILARVLMGDLLSSESSLNIGSFPGELSL
jgi:hypothetical protein